MPHSPASNWFVLTLSAEQAAKDQDFEHLDTLMRRREELLEEWEQSRLQFTPHEQEQILLAETRLIVALEDARDQTGNELRELTRRKNGSNKYRIAA
jgi:dsDNA-specific endonuclease/ATPase MutS2